jgi:hypothetical protein
VLVAIPQLNRQTNKNRGAIPTSLIIDEAPAESRVLQTWTLAQALPPLGRALDIRDSHPARKLTGREIEVTKPHSRILPNCLKRLVSSAQKCKPDQRASGSVSSFK